MGQERGRRGARGWEDEDVNKWARGKRRGERMGRPMSGERGGGGTEEGEGGGREGVGREREGGGCEERMGVGQAKGETQRVWDGGEGKGARKRKSDWDREGRKGEWMGGP
jgi:hypothetical protein